MTESSSEESRYTGSGNKAARKLLTVGIVTTSFPVYTGHASGIFVERLVRALCQHVDLRVLLPSPDQAMDSPEDSAYSVICFRYGPRGWQKLAHRPGGIPDALKRNDRSLLLIPFFVLMMFLSCIRLAGRVDLLHGNWSIAGMLAAAAARLRGKPSLVTLRGEDINRAKNSRIFKMILKRSTILNHYSVCVSQAMCEELSAMFPELADRILFIPNGVNSPESIGERCFHDPVRLVTVGSCIQRKRLDVILRAIAQPGVKGKVILRVVGDGPELVNLTGLVRELGVAGNVEFLGAVPPARVWDHLKWADIFVFSSESEGRPNAVLEAMATRLPVVASDIPGVSELIDADLGVLYPVGNADALAESLRAMIRNPEEALQYGINAQAALDRMGLTWAASAERYFSVYEKMIDREIC
jgi:glycosyltransferase involved in cell wall biosynthesis